MAWSLSYQSIRNPELADALLLAAGKALYLATAFESKCKSVLLACNLVEAIVADPILGLEQAIAALPKRKMLGGTLRDMLRHRIGDDSTTAELLDKARMARNFIAHEAVAVGPIWSLRAKAVVQHANLLRSAVDDLIAGDNVVSTWCYEIEAKGPAPQHFKSSYSAMVNDWVFDHLDHLIGSIDNANDGPRTIRDWLGLA